MVIKHTIQGYYADNTESLNRLHTVIKHKVQLITWWTVKREVRG